MVKVLQCNINHCRIAQDLLAQYILEKRIGIAVISEPYNIPGTTNWSSNTNNNVAIWWNYEFCKSSGIKYFSGEYTLAMSWQDFSIIACYFPPNLDSVAYGDFLNEMDNAYNIVNKSKTIVCGDFNSKSQFWGSKYTDARGERLERWMNSKDLRLINEGTTPTCVRPQGQSVVDITWSTPDILGNINDWCVLEDESYSDHKYIYFTMKEESNNLLTNRKYSRWKATKMDIDKFQESIEWNCIGDINCRNADEVASWIQTTLTDACNFSMPVLKK